MNILAEVSNAGALSLIGWLIVIGCLLGAAWCAFHQALVAAVGLLVVAIIAAALLL